MRSFEYVRCVPENFKIEPASSREYHKTESMSRLNRARLILAMWNNKTLGETLESRSSAARMGLFATPLQSVSIHRSTQHHVSPYSTPLFFRVFRVDTGAFGCTGQGDLDLVLSCSGRERFSPPKSAAGARDLSNCQPLALA